MKRTFLVFALTGLGLTAMASTPIDTAKKVKTDTIAKPAPKAYTADPNKVFHIVLDLSEEQVFSLLATSEGTLEDSELKGKQIKAIKEEAIVVRSFINSQVTTQKIDDYKKWQADNADPKPIPIKK